MAGLEKAPSVLWLDESVEPDGVRSRRQVTFGMFARAVRCGIISEGVLVENAKQVGSVLYQLVRLYHGTGFVDVDVEAFLG
jgi:hypothetical protein